MMTFDINRLCITLISLMILFMAAAFVAGAQEIVTADDYFESISSTYGEITDYEAEISVVQGEAEMEGTIYYKSPNKLRIDFTAPEDQYLLVNDEALTIFIPEHQVLLKQHLPRRSKASLASMASSQGLIYLRENYKIAYVLGPEPVPLDEGSGVMVVNLKFMWRATAEGFKDLEIAFDEDGLIRRVKGITATNVEVMFDFSNIRINQGLPDEHFLLDDPPSAYEYKNFLFGDEE